jgi:four helix bundle protein
MKACPPEADPPLAEKHENKEHENRKTGKQENNMENFKDKLKRLMDEYVHFVYRVIRDFPNEEKFSSVSQWRRSTLSVVLNYIEGFARRKPLAQLNFYEQSYGSFKESKYLLYFSYKEKFIAQEDYDFGLKLAEEIGKMLWSEIDRLEKSINSIKQ